MSPSILAVPGSMDKKRVVELLRYSRSILSTAVKYQDAPGSGAATAERLKEVEGILITLRWNLAGDNSTAIPNHGLFDEGELPPDVVSPIPVQNVIVKMTMGRTPSTFGCATLGYVDRDGCRDEHEEWMRLYGHARARGYEILSHVPATGVAKVRLPR